MPEASTARHIWNVNAASRHASDQNLTAADHADVTELLGLQAGARILDAGCGTGHRAAALAAIGADVVAVDIADAMVAYAARAVPGQVVHGDVRLLPFPDDRFDAALCAYVLDFVPDPVPALHELRRIIRPHGRLLVVVAGATRGPRQDSWRRFIGSPSHAVGPFPWELEALLDHTGWQVVFQQGVFGTDRAGNPSPAVDPTSVDPDTWKTGLQALADGWRILAVAE